VLETTKKVIFLPKMVRAPHIPLGIAHLFDITTF